MKVQFIRFLRHESGVSAIEYALLAGLIAAVIVVGVGKTGSQVLALFNFVKSQVVQATS